MAREVDGDDAFWVARGSLDDGGTYRRRGGRGFGFRWRRHWRGCGGRCRRSGRRFRHLGRSHGGRRGDWLRRGDWRRRCGRLRKLGGARLCRLGRGRLDFWRRPFDLHRLDCGFLLAVLGPIRLWLHVRADEVDDVTRVVAKGADIHFVQKAETHQRRFPVDFRIERIHQSRQRRLGVGEIELDRRIERQRQAFLAMVGRDGDLIRHVEYVARECRLGGDTNAHRRDLALLGKLLLLALQAFGLSAHAWPNQR